MSFIKVKNLKKTYHYDDFDTLYDLTFDIDRGETTTLIVGKGCGKTTIAKILVGLEQKTQGDIFFDDIPIENLPPKERKIAFVTVPSIYDKGKVKNNVIYGLLVRGVKKKDAQSIALSQLKQYNLDVLMEQKVKKLSLLDKTKLDFARAFTRPVDLLILDGCFGIDEQIDDFLTNEIRQKQLTGCAVLILTDDKKYAKGNIYDFLPSYEKN